MEIRKLNSEEIAQLHENHMQIDFPPASSNRFP